MRVALIVDIVRQEEKLIAKALKENKIEYILINVAQELLPFNKALSRYDIAIIRPASMYSALYSAVVLEAARGSYN